jgi:hypothetical protein
VAGARRSNTTKASSFFDVTSGLAPLRVKSGWIIVFGADHVTARFIASSLQCGQRE